MGLREKVALLVTALILAQIVRMRCLSNTNNLKILQNSYKPKRGPLTKAKNAMSVSSKDDSIKRAFNFPDVDYPLPPTFISSKYSNPNLQQAINQPENYLRNVSPQSLLKKKRKYSDIGIKTVKKTPVSPLPEHKVTQKPFSFNSDYFPNVEYPQDASDLWKTHHWDRVLNIKPEMIQNVKEIGKNNKATNKLTAKRIKDGIKRYGIKYPRIYQLTSNKDRFSVANLTSSDDPYAKFNKTNVCEPTDNKTVFIVNDIKLTDSCTDVKNLLALPSADPLTQCNEMCIADDLYTLSQVTPSPDLLSMYKGYINETSLPSPSVTRKIVCTGDENLFDFQVLESSDFNNTDKDNCAQDASDDMGYTVMYPEVFSSLTTSTMAPMDCNEADNIWTWPELDNHTLNMYSDELEQYYILVND